MTLDVSFLYTNIPHEDRIQACKSFLEKDGISTERITEIEELMKLVLENNHFKFDGKHYLQKLGTAMGSSMAPSYASLFMGKFEEDFLQSRTLAPTVWFRFLDDIFMIWDHTYEELESFISDINSFHPCINFFCSTCKQCIPFLDVQVIKSSSIRVETDIYEKPTNNHQYLDYTSCHPKSCKDGIPYSQSKRYRRIISNYANLQSSLVRLKGFFMERGYPSDVLDICLNKVANLSQEETPEEKLKTTESVIPFTVKYNASLPEIGRTIHKYWSLLNLSKNDCVKEIFCSSKPTVAFNRPKNLQDFLVSSDLKSNRFAEFKSQSCNSKRCSHCNSIAH